MRIPPPIAPREHGAWAVLIAPMLIAAASLNAWTIDFFVFLLAVLLFFMAYLPLQILLRTMLGASLDAAKLDRARFWAIAYGGMGALLILPELGRGKWFLLAFGVVAGMCFIVAFLITRGKEKTVAGDLTAIAGLVLGGPAARYVLLGVVDRGALLLYLVNVLFFACGVWYVHMKIEMVGKRGTRATIARTLSLARGNFLYHLVLIGILALAASQRWISNFLVIAFVPMLIYSFVGTFGPPEKIRFKAIGWILTALTVFFVWMVSLAERI